MGPVTARAQSTLGGCGSCGRRGLPVLVCVARGREEVPAREWLVILLVEVWAPSVAIGRMWFVALGWVREGEGWWV